jgi:PhnB protein
MTKQVKPVPDGYHSVTPYLIVKGAAAAIDFYRLAFDAVELFRMPKPDGGIGHAEIRIGNSSVMLADEHPEMGLLGPQSLGGTSVQLLLYVENVDLVTEKAVPVGLKILRSIQNQFYGDRSGNFEDPFGHRWTIATHLEDVSPEEMKRRAAAAYKK